MFEPERLKDLSVFLRPLAGVDEYQVVGAVDETLIRRCGIQTSARSVWVHPSVIQKIVAKRGAQRGDAEFALQYLARTILTPHFFGMDPRDMREGRLDLVHLVHEIDGRPLHVALKFVRAEESATGVDEIWVSTSYPISRNFRRRNRYEHLVEVDWL